MDDEDEDSCLLHEFTSPTCSRVVSPARCRAETTACCSTSPACHPCPPCMSCPILTSSRPPPRLTKFDELNSQINSLRRKLRSNSNPRGNICSSVLAGVDDPLTCHCIRWDVSLVRALRRDLCSLPERRSDGRTGTRIRQPGRADVGFMPKKGDLIIHHEKKPGQKVMEFYDPIFQRLHDGDILVRFKIDSYSCEGIVEVKGSAYIYHHGFWVYLGKDLDQVNRSCNW